MKVKVAKSAGFCIGVKRAVELVLRLADEHRGKRIFTLGPLIHNPQTVEMLREKGIGVLESPQDGSAGDIVVIRSHGIPPQTRQKLAEAGYTIFDATCPKVAHVHAIVRRYSGEGYAVIIVGDAQHAEVVGIKGEATTPVAVVASPDEVAALPDWEKVVVVAQTTMDRQTFESVVDAVKRKFENVVVKNTLCSETSFRQDEIKELASEADAFVVIGGRNSANTRRLYKLASQTGLPTFWVESASQLSADDFLGIERVAVVAGASTPHWVVDAVVERLATMHRRFLPPWRWRWLKNIAYAVLRSNFLAAAAAATLTGTIAMAYNLPNPVPRAFATCTLLFALTNLYQHREWQGMALMDPSKIQFVRQTKHVLLPAALLSLAAAVALSAALGAPECIATAVIAAAVLAYWRLGVLEHVLPAFIKDGFVLLAWISAIWFLGTPLDVGALLSIAVFGGLRGLALGLKELETDRILQRKSMTATLGRRLSMALGALAALVGVALALAAPTSMLPFAAGAVAMWVVAAAVGARIIRRGTYIETIVEGIVLITALLFPLFA